MKKYSFLIASTITASLLLAACGTNEEATPEKEENTSTTVETTEQTDTTETAETENDSTTEEVEAPEQSNTSTGTTTTPEKTETKPETETEAETETTVETVTPASTVTYTTSPEQNYEVALQKGYSIVAEEPGRDMVVSDTNSNISMRVETFTKADATYKDLAQLAQDTVSVTAPEGKYETIDLAAVRAKNNDVLNAAGYKIVYQEDAEQSVTVVFEKADKIVQLTIFDTTENAFTNILLEMGFTVR